MYCRKCGASVPNGSKFCSECGNKIEYQRKTLVSFYCPYCNKVSKFKEGKPVIYCPYCGIKYLPKNSNNPNNPGKDTGKDDSPLFSDHSFIYDKSKESTEESTQPHEKDKIEQDKKEWALLCRLLAAVCGLLTVGGVLGWLFSL